MGLSVRVVTCDQGPNNRKCYELLGGSSTNPYFYHQNSKIYFRTPDGLARFDVVREIFELEHSKVTKMTKLTTCHLNPNSFEKMRVCLAVQTLSHSVAAAIECANGNRQMSRTSPEIAASTSKFI